MIASFSSWQIRTLKINRMGVRGRALTRTALLLDCGGSYTNLHTITWHRTTCTHTTGEMWIILSVSCSYVVLRLYIPIGRNWVRYRIKDLSALFLKLPVNP